jgi:signal transduction histidine kinase/ActR/RegA family two-component response regulator
MATQRRDITVLLVEDSPTQRAVYKDCVQGAGFQVRLAKNGAEALLSLGEKIPDIVVSDCNMPLVDGFQLCRLLKDHPSTRRIPVLLLTGTVSRLSRFWARTCGADMFLLKEEGSEKFLATLDGLFHSLVSKETEEDSGIWQLGLSRKPNINVEDVSSQLALALEHRLLEITVRNAVASLQDRIQEPDQVAWGFLNLLQDLVAPGALYFLAPTPEGSTCYLLASPSVPEKSVQTLLEGIHHLSFLRGAQPKLLRENIDWELGAPRNLVTKHYRLQVPNSGITGQWGLLIEREAYQVHRLLFREASSEFQKLFQVMVVLQLLETSNQKLKQTDEIKTAFVRTLSHDMRSPLGGIRLALDSMKAREEDLPDGFKGSLDIGLRSVDRLIRMVNGVLDLEKMEAGCLEFKAQVVDAAEQAAEAVRAMELLASSGRIRIVQKPAAGGGFRINVDPDRFQQILVNLLSNAIKFSPSTSEIQVELRNDPGEIAVAVRDHGAGVPEHFKARIFGKFQQAERKDGGTGLGLAITKQLTERMGGAIGFESREGEGSTFEVRFPSCETAAIQGTPDSR